jgi:hypothetical protein
MLRGKRVSRKKTKTFRTSGFPVHFSDKLKAPTGDARGWVSRT